MYVTFPRLRNRETAWVQIEPGDGAVYRLIGGRSGNALPRYAKYLIVERELGLADGFWGGIAAGAVYPSMRELRPSSGTRLDNPKPLVVSRATRGIRPRGTRHSADLIREERDRVRRAELLTDLAEAVAALDDPTPQDIRRLTGRMLPVLSTGIAPGPDLLAAAAAASQADAKSWARLLPGEELVYEWL